MKLTLTGSQGRTLWIEWGAMTEFQAFLSDESGASSAEYALILAIVGGGIVLAAMTLGSAIGESTNAVAECIATQVC